MGKSKKIILTLIFIIILIVIGQTNKIYAKSIKNNITAGNNYINDKTLTYKKLENGETLISGFKIGEKVSEVLVGKFGEDYTIKIKNNQGREITNEPNTKIGTGNKIELYEKTGVGVRGTEPRKNIYSSHIWRCKWRCKYRSSRCTSSSKKQTRNRTI